MRTRATVRDRAQVSKKAIVLSHVLDAETPNEAEHAYDAFPSKGSAASIRATRASRSLPPDSITAFQEFSTASFARSSRRTSPRRAASNEPRRVARRRDSPLVPLGVPRPRERLVEDRERLLHVALRFAGEGRMRERRRRAGLVEVRALQSRARADE